MERDAEREDVERDRTAGETGHIDIPSEGVEMVIE